MRFSTCLAALTGALLPCLPSLAFADPVSFDRGPFLERGREPAQTARTIALARAAHAAALGDSKSIAFADGQTVVRLPQMHAGVPVALRGATVTFAREGRGRLLATRLERDLAIDTTPSVDAVQAAEIAGVVSMPSSRSRRVARRRPRPSRAKVTVAPRNATGTPSWTCGKRTTVWPSANAMLFESPSAAA